MTKDEPKSKAKSIKKVSVKKDAVKVKAKEPVKKMPAKKAVSKTKTNKVSKPKTSEFRWLKSYPSTIKWDIKIPDKPLWDLMDEAAANAHDRPCVDFLGKKFTYGEVGELVNKMAQGLQKQGVKKGTKVGIFMPNAVYYVISYFAILKAGGVVVNYNPLYTDSEVTYQINDSSTEIMVTLDLALLYEKLVPLMRKTSLKKLVVCSVAQSLPFPKNYLFKIFKSKEIAKVEYSKNIINFDDLTSGDGKYKAVAVNPKKDVALLQYTGGTTGVPKGAMLSHRNVYANALQAQTWFERTEYGQERFLAGLPLFHVYAMTAIMTLAVRNAAEMVLMFPRFNAQDAMKMIQKHKITFFPGVPTMYNMISNQPNVSKVDMSSLKACLSGGAALPQKVKEEFESLTGCKLVEAYGLSETSPAATSNPIYALNKTGSIGIPFPGTEVAILSLEDPRLECPVNINGQIAIKGPQVMLGYWNRPEDTKKTFEGEYFLTGDVGYMDEEGYTFLVDRIKDLIICSGFNVYPRMVEEVIYKHPDVAEVTVIGVPDEKRGESVKAFVKLKDGRKLTEENLASYLKDKLSPIEMPKYIEFRDELPKTMIGKLSKKELKAEENQKK
jgi:long-chain acyl-CoA synthetase